MFNDTTRYAFIIIATLLEKAGKEENFTKLANLTREFLLLSTAVPLDKKMQRFSREYFNFRIKF